MKLTNNFYLEEFECSCGCEMPDHILENVKELAKNLQRIRDAVKSPLTLTNGYRCESHNKKVGGVKSSQHLLGKAADIQSGMFPPSILADKIKKLIEEDKISEGGVGEYKTFTHYDIRGTKARW